MNPSGTEMIAGFARSYHENRPPSESGPGHTVGLTITSAIEVNVPISTPVTAPDVLNLRHVSASSSAGNIALAATANARPTMNDTFRPSPPITAIEIAIAPIANAAIFATQTSSFSESVPRRTMFDHTSCATAPEAEITRPATTARIVANATAAMIARNRSPPKVPAPPPTSSASSGAARLPPVPTASVAPSPRIARAPKPSAVVMT